VADLLFASALDVGGGTCFSLPIRRAIGGGALFTLVISLPPPSRSWR